MSEIRSFERCKRKRAHHPPEAFGLLFFHFVWFGGWLDRNVSFSLFFSRHRSETRRARKSHLVALGNPGMSFWRILMAKGAGVAEREIHRKLTNSQSFKNVVHTVQRKGVRHGGKKLLEEASPGAFSFARVFLDELKTDLGFKKPVQAQKPKALPRVQKRQ